MSFYILGKETNEFYESKEPLDLLLGMDYKAIKHDMKCCACIEDRENHFIVIEQLHYQITKNKKRVNKPLLMVFKKNLTTEEALRLIARELKMPISCFTHFGAKDAKASTIQYILVDPARSDCKTANIEQIKQIKIYKIAPPRKLLWKKIGDVSLVEPRGNKFTIILKSRCYAEKLAQQLNSLNRKLLPNYYGYQRFGVTRPSNQVVSFFYLRSAYGLALAEYIDSPYPDESLTNINARITLLYKEINKGENEAKLKIKRGAIYEKTVLNCLRKPRLKKCASLAVRLSCIMLGSIQSWLFNKYLSLRIKENIAPNEIISGEKRQKSNIYAPVVGRGIRLQGKTKELYEYLAETYGINLQALKNLRECGIKGFWRQLWIKTTIKVIKLDNKILALRFQLPRGSYATNVLREIACSPLCIT